MEIGLIQKQTMNLVMTTELRQAIALLQYSTIDLSRFIQEQAIENPLIELEERPLDVQFEDRRMPRNSASANSYNGNGGDSVSPLDFVTNDDYDLRDDMLEQAQWLAISEQERSVLQYLILNLDDNGYLPISTMEIASQLSITENDAEQGRKLLQQLEPLGVGARDLKECLLLQAQEYYPDEPLLSCVINDYLELLAAKKWSEISRCLDISLEEINRVVECIQTLDPKPCAKLSNNSAQYLYPDIMIEKDSGEYRIALFDSFLPKLQVNQQYMKLVKTSDFVKENYQKYMWLVKSIEQRKNTFLKISNAIVEKQRDFLDNGFSHLQPMTLKEIASEIGMHESTVSRATNNKVIQTPNGSFEMRRLFTSKLGKNDENNTSSTKVKLLLKQLINDEDKRKPLSDQKISDYFKKQNGITISRRTVTKYREELKILSSTKRKTIV